MNFFSDILRQPKVLATILWAAAIIAVFFISLNAMSAAADSGNAPRGETQEVGGEWLENGLADEDAAQAEAIRKILDF